MVMGSALIFDRSSFPCGDRHCHSPATLLARNGLFRCLTELAGCATAAPIHLIPDIALIRVSDAADAEQLIARCRARWNDTPILLMLCRAPDTSYSGLRALVEAADDFLYCAASEPELELRSTRLHDRSGPKYADEGHET